MSKSNPASLPLPPTPNPPPQPKLVLNKVAILLKRELTLDLVEEALKILMYLQENLLGKDIFR